MSKNSTDVINRLTPYCNNPPLDLVEHFSRPLPIEVPNLWINILDLEASLEYTKIIQEHTLLGKGLGLVVLDDANNSNPFCYVTCGATRGWILHFYHDDDPKFEFSSLLNFNQAIQDAISAQRDIDDLVVESDFSFIDQSALNDRLVWLATEDQEGMVEEIITLFPLLQTSPVASMKLLAKHNSFYVREALACHIREYPTPELADIARMLSRDSQPQVAQLGKAAFTAISALTGEAGQ